MPDVLDLPVRELIPAAFAEEMGGSEERQALLSSVLASVVREVAGVLGDLSAAQAAATLRERSPAAAVAGLLVEAATAHLTREQHELAAALLHGAVYQRELLAGAGGLLGSEAVATLLGITRQAVDKRRLAGSLLALRAGGPEWSYPALQFGPHGAVLPGFSDLLRRMADLGPWGQLERLLIPDPALSAAALGVAAAGGEAAEGAAAPRRLIDVLRAEGHDPRVFAALIARVAQAGDPDRAPAVLDPNATAETLRDDVARALEGSVPVEEDDAEDGAEDRTGDGAEEVLGEAAREAPQDMLPRRLRAGVVRPRRRA